MKLRVYFGFVVLLLVLNVSDPVFAFEEWDYGSTGSNQTFEVDMSGEYRIEVWGSQGGGNGGKGGYVSVKTNLLKGDVLNIFVGDTSGYNGGGSGSAVGGGATDVRLNGLSLSDRLVVGAGGGGGSGGTDGGTGNGAGGTSVGSGAGSAGVDGGGGGRSYNYTYQTGYWQDTGYYRDTGYTENITETKSTGYWRDNGYYDYYAPYYDNGVLIPSRKVFVPTGGQTFVVTGYDIIVVGTRFVKTGTEWVSTGSTWVSTGYSTSSGRPGNGGSNFVKSGLDVESILSGVNVSNGRVKITQLVAPPEITFGSVSTDYVKSLDVTFTLGKGTNDVSHYFLPDGTRVDGELSGTFNVMADGTYTVRAVDVLGFESSKDIVIDRIDREGPSGNIDLSSNTWGGSTAKPLDIVISGISDNKIGIKEIVTPRGVVNMEGKISYTYRVDRNGLTTFTLRDKLGNESTKSISVSNYDSDVPGMTLEFNGKLNTPYRSFDMLVNATDGLSGVDYVDYQFYSGVSPVVGNYKRLTDLTKKLESPILEGTYGIDFKVVDRAGNQLSSSFSKSYIIDRTAPTFDVQVPSGWAKSKRVRLVNIVDTNLSHGVYLAEGVYTGDDYAGDFRSTTSNELEWMYDVSTDQISLTLTDAAGNYTTKVVNVTGLDGYRPNSPTIVLDSLVWSKAGLGFTLIDKGDTGDLTHRSGVEKLQYSFDQVEWFDYSVGAKLPEDKKGLVTLYARAVDKAGNVSDVVSAFAKIDDMPPVFDSIKVEKIGDKNFVVVNAVDIHSGLATDPYRFEKRIEGVRGYESLRNWGSVPNVEIVEDVPNALYVFRASARDLNNNEVVSNEVGYVSAPEVTENVNSKRSNNVTFTLDRSLSVSDGVSVEVYRSGRLLKRIVSGDTFEDFNLDYEKTYNYEFVTVAEFSGETLRSKPFKLSVETGLPEVSFELFGGDVRKTVFSDVVNLRGVLTYRTGGKFDIDVKDSSGRTLLSKIIDVVPYVSNKFDYEVDVSDVTDSRLSVSIVQGGTGVLDQDIEFEIEETVVMYEKVGSSLNKFIY